jgi:hypothetical protein
MNDFKILTGVFGIVAALFLGLSVGFAQIQTVKLTIDAKNQSTVISLLLFGHNLEHTRKAIWQGISAEMINNRKFAAVDGKQPMGWYTLSGTGVSIDDKVSFAGKHSYCK